MTLRSDSVSLLEAGELVGRRFPHVLLGGLSDGQFPRWARGATTAEAGRLPPAPWLSDAERIRLNRSLSREALPVSSGRDAERIRFGLAQERLLFYLSLSAATESLVLTFARRGARGEQEPSPFLDALCRWTGVAITSTAYRPVPGWNEVWTEAELRARVAIEVAAEPQRALLQTQFGAEDWFSAALQIQEIEGERLRFFTSAEAEEGRFSGALTAPGLLGALGSKFAFSREHPWSASSLFQFGNCAYQGFLSYALGLGEEERAGEEMDARTEGTLWHAVLEELLPTLKAQRLLGRPADEVPDSVLDAAVDEAWSRAEARAHVGHPALGRLGRARARSMVRRLLDSPGKALPFEGGEPAEVELGFGRDASPQGWREVRVPGGPDEPDLYLRGTIDRLDRGPWGAAVIDYKSGALAPAPVLYDSLMRTEFQLPVYLYAARTAFPGTPLRGAWMSLKDAEPVELGPLLARRGGSLEVLLSDDPATRSRAAQDGAKNLPNA
ncbi:MAG TPA: PD-(D/E)XK nuclease family protein, partial [Myxococcaceae bacterium]|nr:PD-(D/E)XK nuclease family protein [Myxococcaceae bacterium]